MSNSTSSSAPASATVPGPHPASDIPQEAVLPEVPPVSPGYPAKIEELQLPDFWPEGLDPVENQRVSQWLLGHGEWQGQEPGWKHYALDPATASLKPGTWAWRNKRTMDLMLTLLGLPFALPIMFLTAVALKISSPKEKILFKQWRPGYLCKPFQLLKFRTMRSSGDSESPREDSQRLTRLGRFFRHTSIDELPQLFNVLKGEMSLVGPRPHLLAYLSRYRGNQIFRHGAPMGLTGFSQVSGRNHLSGDSRYACDLEYCQKRSLAFDLILMLQTIPQIFFSTKTQVTTSKTYKEFGI